MELRAIFLPQFKKKTDIAKEAFLLVARGFADYFFDTLSSGWMLGYILLLMILRVVREGMLIVLRIIKNLGKGREKVLGESEGSAGNQHGCLPRGSWSAAWLPLASM